MTRRTEEGGGKDKSKVGMAFELRKVTMSCSQQ